MEDITTLLGNLERENFEHKPFIPFGELETLFTREKVDELLQQHHLEFHLINETVDRVLDGGLKVFALLAAVHDIKSITRFIKEDQFSEVSSLDARLPLKETDISRYFSNPDKGKLFYRRQWSYLAPVFSENRSRSLRELDDRIILPFLPKKNLIAEGGFGKVYKVKIEASHYIFRNAQRQRMPTPPPELICKELERPDDKGTLAEEFGHEVSILSALQCLEHPNIIPLITAFSKGTTYTFLLPAADGDLRSILNSNHRLPGFQTETEIFGSLWGLSSALNSVHNYFFPQLNVRKIGCHYDIKPSNILIRDRTLLLSDFGLSRLRQAEDGSQTTFKKGEGYYMAPECESGTKDFERGRIGRASDVWSLGCVLAEILAYFRVEPPHGPTAVQNFIEDRRLKVGSYVAYMFYGEEEVNPGVHRYLERCKADLNLSDGLRSLARVVDKILQFDQAQRPSAMDITRLLFHLTQRTRITATAAITSTFDKDFGSLDLELEIEIERLSIWSNTVGLRSDPLDVPASTWFAADHSFEEYENLQLLLIKIEIEIDTIAKEFLKTKSSRPAFRLYYRLQKLQDQLWDGQPSTVRRHMFDRLEENMLSKKNHAKSQSASKSIHSADGDSGLPSTELFRRRFAFLETMRDVASALLRQDRPMQDLRVAREFIKGPWSNLGPHEVGIFEPTSKRVLIEYLHYGEAWASRTNELLERVKGIASLRSRIVSEFTESIFPILECHGCYHDPSRNRFGIVYQLPTEAKNKVPVSLLMAFEETKSEILRPSLSQRYKLVSALVSHVLSFHRGGWLHKSISAFNIICFPDAFPSIADSLASPYFIGFNHSRVNEEDEYSAPPELGAEYQHPAYLRNTQAFTDDTGNAIVRFRQEFDYFSVGMVLMEIAFWKPLKELIRAGSPEEVLEKILKNLVPRIKVRMGDLYSAAVQYCLSIVEQRQHSLEKVRDDFNENVVLPLSRCLV